ncbi:hypothetical protein [Pseudomonas sp. MWU12-2323]|uniref:hypothetical protein n=1 Tax=Pseudomonas sp. MWU12-2323 TaxID=2651296 RepID=UPI00128D7C5E|nr:hypothetical protein [Pseudomonas sp. MWU12-2323]MPQ69255.1 hypothetical protein [Pseudomonas sp. MWU12-2323]
MSLWTYARIDRIESGEVHCIFCKRALRSGRLIVIHDEAGVEAYVGPACAKKHLGAPTEPILDLSKMAVLLVLKEAKEAGESHIALDSADDVGHAQPNGHRQLIEVDEVASYLRLRAEHMPGFSGNATQRLREFHEQLFSDGGLTDSARLYVERLLAKSKAANTIYSARNVERCIGAAYWLKVAIEHTKPERREFLGKMLRSLREHWRLTSKQVEGINKWGAGVRKTVLDFPVLDASAFDGVKVPRFGAPQNNGN